MHFKALAMADSLLLNVSNTYIFRFIISFIIVILVFGDLKTSNFMYFSEREMHASWWDPNKMERFFEKLSADRAKVLLWSILSVSWTFRSNWKRRNISRQTVILLKGDDIDATMLEWKLLNLTAWIEVLLCVNLYETHSWAIWIRNQP